MPLNQVLEQRVLTVEISRPEKRNTLDAKTLEEFTALLANAEADDNVRVIVITAQPGIFCAGGDLKEQLENPSASSDSPAGRFITQLQTMTKPMMACVEGPCVGFGTTILYYCDLVYAGASSLFPCPLQHSASRRASACRTSPWPLQGCTRPPKRSCSPNPLPHRKHFRWEW